MAEVNANVTAGTVLTKDSEGRSLWTTDKLNLLGTPNVSITLPNNDADGSISDGAIDTDQLADDAVTNAKMADNAIGNAEMADNAVGVAEITSALAAFIPTINMTLSDQTGGVGRCNIQMQDAKGSDITGRFVLTLWVSSLDFGAATGLTTFPVTPITTGTFIDPVVANNTCLFATDANGVLEFDFNNGGGGFSAFIMAECSGRAISDTVTVT